jgi:hypothetical protein
MHFCITGTLLCIAAHGITLDTPNGETLGGAAGVPVPGRGTNIVLCRSIA